MDVSPTLLLVLLPVSTGSWRVERRDWGRGRGASARCGSGRPGPDEPWEGGFLPGTIACSKFQYWANLKLPQEVIHEYLSYRSKCFLGIFCHPKRIVHSTYVQMGSQIIWLHPEKIKLHITCYKTAAQLYFRSDYLDTWYNAMKTGFIKLPSTCCQFGLQKSSIHWEVHVTPAI